LINHLKLFFQSKKKICAWGCVDNLKGSWDKMREGDYVLFYVKGIFKFYGKVLCKQYSDQLSDALWPRKNKNAWGSVFFLDDIREISIPLETLSKIAGYKDNFVPQKFQELKEEAVEKILREYGSMENFFDKESKDFNTVVEKIEPADINIILKNSEKWKLEINKETHEINTGVPETVREIVKYAAQGEWVLPAFQRNYVWNEEQIRELLESILLDYFIGNFLIWEVKGNKNNLPLGTDYIEGTDPKSDRVTGIILDGQQRITSLYKATMDPEIVWFEYNKTPSYFYVDFNAWMGGITKDSIVEITHKKYSDEETYESLYFPLYQIDSYRKWTDGLRKYLRYKKGIDDDKIDDIIDFISTKLDHFWKNYKVPIIRLPENIDLNSMSIIFERINTKGLELNVFDLLVARLFRYEVELRKLWDEIKEKNDEIRRYYKIYKEKIQVSMVQGMSLYYNPTHSAKRKDILNIFESVYKSRPKGSFETDWNDFARYLKEAINRMENLRNGYGIKGEKNLPSTSTLPVLATLLKEIEKRGRDASLYRKIDRWYWSAVLTNTYSGAASTAMAQDVKDVIDWFNNDEKIPRTVEQARRKWESRQGLEYLKEMVSPSNSTYKGILSLIGLKGAKDFMTDQTFESSAVNNFDHIFPKSKFKEHQYVNSILNITWLTDKTNKHIKKAKLPSEFIKEFRVHFNSEEEFEKVLESHFITKEAYQAMKEDNFDKFLEERGNAILKEINNRINGSY